MDEKNLPGVTDDNPEDQDEALETTDDEDADEDVEEDVEEETGDEKPEDNAVAKPDETKPDKEPDKTQTPSEATFTQAQLDRILEGRLARDRKSQVVREVESILGAPLEELVGHLRQTRIEEAQTTYAMSEDEAKRYITEQERLHTLEAERQAMLEQQRAMEAVTAYQQDKTKHVGNPLAKKYEADIDAFAQNGLAGINYATAMSYVIGQKVLAGEVLGNVKKATEQRVLANIQKRSTVKPEGGQGAAQTVSLTPLQIQVARSLGVDPKRYAANLTQLKKSKQSQ